MIWIDAQISPAIAVWVTANFPEPCLAVRDVGLRDAEDREIFLEARKQSAIVMTKDFILLQNELGAPPKIIWLTCGNTSNARLKEILINTLPEAIRILNSGENLIEMNAV